MSNALELIHVVDDVVGALRRHSIAYFITGSFASSVHGEFRATNDIDIVAEADVVRLRPLLTELAERFVVDLSSAESSWRSEESFNLIHTTTYLKVDMFPVVSDFNRAAIVRAIPIDVPGARESLRVSSVEDIILAKLRWYRLGDEVSSVQQRDVRRLIELNRDILDGAYLAHWAEQLRVGDLLRQALA